VRGCGQAFFPGEEGAGRSRGALRSGQPVGQAAREHAPLRRRAAVLLSAPTLGEGDEVSNLSTTPAPPFGHGLSYTTFEHTDLTVPRPSPTDGPFTVSVRVTNTGRRRRDVVQLYGRDLVGSVTRPVAALLGYRRVHLAPGESVTVEFTVPDHTARVLRPLADPCVEPGDVELWVGTSARRRHAGSDHIGR
jgi:beta-glucosidase